MRQKAFTLIELLVVIAVIGVISSIVLVNVRGSREKARLARNLQFSKSIHHALGAYAVAVWSFDRFGTTITDLSGYDNHCALVNTPTEVEGIVGRAINFDALDADRLYCGSKNLGMNTSSGITVEAWAKPDKVDSRRKIIAKTGTFYLSINDGKIHHDSCKPGLGWAGPDLHGVTSIKPGEWHHFAFSWDGSSVVKLYLDGKEEDSDNTDIMILASAGHLNIGSYDNVSHHFDGIIDEVRIYNEALTLSQIQKHYVEGLNKYKLAGE